MRTAADLEALDSIEQLFLEIDGMGPDSPQVLDRVHILFRIAHSLKGSLKMAGDAEAAEQVHRLETELDAARNRSRPCDRTLVHAGLATVDRLRGSATRAPAAPSPASRPNSVEAPAGDRVEGPFNLTLTPGEAAAIREAFVAGERVFVVEKLLTGDLGPADYNALPIFDDIVRIGRPIAQRPENYADYEQSIVAGQAVMRLLFATELTAEDLFLEVFDPLTEVRMEDCPFVGQPVPDHWEATVETPRDPRFLVVDDEMTSRYVLFSQLQAFGEVSLASTGAEALELVRMSLDARRPYTSVFLDVMMPNVNGQVVLRRIRQMEHAAGIRATDRSQIIMVSATQDREAVFEAFAGEADGFLTKPVNPASVADTVAAAGRRRGERRAG